MYEMIPQELKGIPQWVCTKNGSKCPFIADSDSPASASNRETWRDFSTAESGVGSKRYDGVGFVFSDNGIVGIDIDDGWDDDGLPTAKASDIIVRCNSYTELSRSGRGFHILIRGQLPFKGRNNQQGCEIYKDGRYFILTGNCILPGLREDQGAIDYVVQRYFPEMLRASEGKRMPRAYSPRWTWEKGMPISIEPEYPVIDNGSRNLSLTSVGGELRTAGYSKADIFRKLLEVNRKACRPPLKVGEVQQIVNSVCRYRR